MTSYKHALLPYALNSTLLTHNFLRGWCLYKTFVRLKMSVSGFNKEPPEINDAYIEETSNELVVRWTIDGHVGLLNFAVIALDTITGNKYSTHVESNTTEASISVSHPKHSFHVTLIASYSCRNFSSEAFVTNTVEEILPTPTPTPVLKCVGNGVKGQGILLNLALYLCNFQWLFPLIRCKYDLVSFSNSSSEYGAVIGYRMRT